MSATTAADLEFEPVFQHFDQQEVPAQAKLGHQGNRVRVDLMAALRMHTRQYARLVDEWVTAIGLRKFEYETHSLCRTKAAMIYLATSNIRALQILLGHTKIENSVRYRGVTIEDALLLAERTEI